MASTSNRRQSTRAVRTSIARPANYYARPHGYGSTNGAPSAAEAQADANPPGFYPAITYFTDAIDALPKEVVRHFTLLRESEGKAYQPEQALAEVVKAIRELPPSDLHTPSQPQTQDLMAISLAGSINGSTHGSIIDGQGPRTDVGDGASQTAERSVSRQQLFDSFNVHLRDMIVVLEEKQTILHQASDCIERQLFRLDDVMPHLDHELSEEARLGSNTHWALAHMKELRKPVVTNERTRRDMQAANNLAAAAAHVHESDITATRSEARREALLAKRGRHNMDSDFDDRPTKKQSSGTKARKEGTMDSKAVKRRRAEKGASTADKPPGPTLNGKGAAESPAEPPKKKTKAPTSAATQAKRKPTNASPSLANLSPTRSTFPSSSLKRDHSPAPAMAKAPSSRGRQNSAAGNPTSRPASSASHLKSASGLGIRTPELKGIAAPTSRPLADARGNPKTAQEPDSIETLVEEPGVQGAFAIAEPPKPDPKLDPLPTDTAATPPDADIAGTRARPSTARNAKTSAPDGAPMSRSRSSRGQHAATNEPLASSTVAAPEPRSRPPSPRRSHKKSASRSNAYQEAIAAETLGTDADEVDEDDENDETASNDPIYCVCNRPSFGDMIACDNDACPTEWFHLECVGLTKPPSSKTKWYCEACKASMKQGNSGR